MPHSGGYPLSRIQISKFSERPSIVPHEVHYGLHVVTRASLVEKSKISSFSLIQPLDIPD
jgi:hypothetical protein